VFVIDTFRDDDVRGVAVTSNVPATQFDAHVTLATPFASVIANGFESVHDAPLAGTLKSTRTLGAGWCDASSTRARMPLPITLNSSVALGGASSVP
jgi:hypothetical protein